MRHNIKRWMRLHSWPTMLESSTHNNVGKRCQLPLSQIGAYDGRTTDLSVIHLNFATYIVFHSVALWVIGRTCYMLPSPHPLCSYTQWAFFPKNRDDNEQEEQVSRIITKQKILVNKAENWGRHLCWAFQWQHACDWEWYPLVFVAIKTIFPFGQVIRN